MPAPKRARKNTKMFMAKPGGEHHQPEREGGPADDGRAPVAVGQPAHRQDAQDEESARDPGHEGDGPGRDVEGRLDVGREDGEPGGLEVVQRDDDGQDDEGACSRRAQPLAQRDLLLARPRQHVLGEQELRHRLGRQLPLGGRIDHQVRQVGRTHVVGGAGTRGPPTVGSLIGMPDPRARPHPRASAALRAAARGVGPIRITTPSLTQERASRSWGCTCRWSPGRWRRAGWGRTRPAPMPGMSAFFSA